MRLKWGQVQFMFLAAVERLCVEVSCLDDGDIDTY